MQHLISRPLRDRFLNILATFPQRHILVVGDVGMDEYIYGAVHRISPEAPVPIIEVKEELQKLGMAANVAENIIALGGHPVLVGLIGDDARAQSLRNKLQEDGVGDNYLVTDPQRPTIHKTRIMAQSIAQQQHIVRVDYEKVFPAEGAVFEQACLHIAENLSNAQALIVEDYGKGMITETFMNEIREICSKFHRPLFIDPNPRHPASWYQDATLITPNVAEAAQMAGIEPTDEAAIIQIGQKLQHDLNIEYVLITRGKDGMTLFRADKEPQTFPTMAREVFDVSGAGDTVIAAMSLGLTSGLTVEESIILANFAAGLEVAKLGTAVVTSQELQELFREMPVQ